MKNDPKKIFNFIAETGSLMFMQRLHHRSLINNFDTVASHSYHVCIIAYCLARMEGLTHDEGIKALAMGMLHDNAEARTGDLDYPSKHYSETNEEKAVTDQLSGLPFGNDLKSIFDEYENRETLISKCAKDADSLEQLYQTWILSQIGNKIAERWYKDGFRDRVPFLRTKSAKKLALATKKIHPLQWWYEDLIEKKINHSYLTGKK